MLRKCFLLAATICWVGCGYGSHSYMGGTMGGAQVANLQPNMATAGGSGFTLFVNGNGFGTDAVVYWNTTPQATSYISGNQVQANITAQDIMNPGMVPVYVRTGGRNSNSVMFTVQ
jgi:hypothetical protein